MKQSRWKLVTSAFISLAILVLAILNRDWIIEAFGLLREAQPMWLVFSFILIALSYFISSQVFHVVLHSLGYHLSWLRVWATALVAIVISQSVPAGGVGSYAFLFTNFTRRGISSGEATLISSLEGVSYTVAMLLIFLFSLIYLAAHGLATTGASYVAALVGIVVIGLAIFVFTRGEATLRRWLLGLKNGIAMLLRRRWSDTWVNTILSELLRARALVASRRRDVVLLVLIQFTALSGHSLAMLLVLHSLGVSVGFPVVMAAFGIALITSTFNVLPGGGGTVEAALVAVLSQLGVGAAAVPAAIIFRLFNFWFVAPVAAACYHWLMHEQVTPLVSRYAANSDLSANAE